MAAATTVLITAAGSAPAQAFIRALRGQNELPTRLVGVDTVAHAGGLYDCARRYTVPRVGDSAFIEAIENVCRAEEVDVVVPIGNFELQRFAEAADSLERALGVRVITNSPQAVALARDKRASADAVARCGVTVPRFHDPAALDDSALPVIVKPRSGAGSHGVSVVREPAELEPALVLAGSDRLVQDFIEGQEYTVDLVIAPSGDVLAAAPRMRIEVRAGQSYKGVTVDDEGAQEAARQCARALGLTGQANVQVIKSSADGQCYFVEANPKFAAAMGLTIGAGLNIPLLYVKLALGIEPRPEELCRRERVWLLRGWEDRVVAESEIAAAPDWRAAHERSGALPG